MNRISGELGENFILCEEKKEKGVVVLRCVKAKGQILYCYLTGDGDDA